MGNENLTPLEKARLGVMDKYAFIVLAEELQAMADGSERYPELKTASQQARDLWQSASEIVNYARKSWWRP